jgi:hypothetical protein
MKVSGFLKEREKFGLADEQTGLGWFKEEPSVRDEKEFTPGCKDLAHRFLPYYANERGRLLSLQLAHKGQECLF